VSKITLSIQTYIDNPRRTIPVIAEYLAEGSLALAIGAGASHGLGLPLWTELVERCIKETNRQKGTHLTETMPPRADNKEVCELMDQVEKEMGGTLGMGRSAAYRELVPKALYDGVHYDNSILKKDLLIAVGALLMGSKRGNVREVFNFNFDDVLDWYLRLHGFDTQIITSLPTLRREPDVTIYHPHGYLPLKRAVHSPSDFLIFSQYSYDEKMSDRQDSWLALFEKTMEDRAFLFVGLSGDDQTFGIAITAVKKKIAKQRFTAFWLFGPDVKENRIRYLADRNIVSLKFLSFDHISEFILSICQKALKV
jgi:hypothetical protein